MKVLGREFGLGSEGLRGCFFAVNGFWVAAFWMFFGSFDFLVHLLFPLPAV